MRKSADGKMTVECVLTDTKTGVTKNMDELSEAELKRVWGIMMKRAARCRCGADYEVREE